MENEFNSHEGGFWPTHLHTTFNWHFCKTNICLKCYVTFPTSLEFHSCINFCRIQCNGTFQKNSTTEEKGQTIEWGEGTKHENDFFKF